MINNINILCVIPFSEIVCLHAHFYQEIKIIHVESAD